MTIGAIFIRGEYIFLAMVVGVIWLFLNLLIPFFILRIRNEIIQLNATLLEIAERR